MGSRADGMRGRGELLPKGSERKGAVGAKVVCRVERGLWPLENIRLMI